LGNFVSNEKGGASFSVVLPTDIPDGYHTIHLNGLSYSGRPVDYYQIVRVLRPDVAIDQPALSVAGSHIATAVDDVPAKDSEIALADSYAVPKVLGSSVMSNGVTQAQYDYVRPVNAAKGQNSIIPETAWLFLGLSFTAYARLRRFR